MTTPEDPYQPPQQGAQPPPGGAPPPEYNAPPPQYGAPPQFPGSGGGYQMPGAPQGPGGAPLAAWGWRVLGYIIDAVIIFIPAFIVGIAVGRAGYDVVALILGLIIAYLNGAQGQSPGKRVVGLRLVRESDGQLIGGGMGIVRAIAHILDTIACLVGWFWPLWDDKRQTFADKIIGTVVVKL
ncbi:MAG TPA: RDD family protein [Mycobacteriales bacterium]|jgi:uncharacterized RDD family membrane protein YckC|nr:RDD family protein [Mycobacteriales bacterium]